MKDTMRKRMGFWRKICDSEVWKEDESEVLKIQKWQKPVDKVRKQTNVGGWSEGKVAAAGGSTEARRKKEKGSAEMRNREEVPSFM